MLLDRTDEREALDRLVDAAKGGLSGALVLFGEPGMGKTTLLDYASDCASDLPISRVVGVEAEQDFSFAALHRLLLPFLDRRETLPQPQRDALASVLGLASPSPVNPFLIGLATLTLLADAASERGLLCVVDDSQWIDSESLQAVAFAARRLRADGIALLFGLRTSGEAHPALAGIPSLEIAGLPDGASLDLLSTVVPGPLDSRIAADVVRETGGCPLALVELAHELTADQWVGVNRVSEPIPISGRLEAHFRRRVETLTPDSQLFLLVAAAESSGDPSVVRRAALQVGCDRNSELDAVAEHLLATEPRVQFRHPLIRSAVYTGASPRDRQRVHQALADSLDRNRDPDRWAQHLAAITTGYDDQLAAHLEAGAKRARDRGGFVAEASLMAQAAALTENTALRSQRLLVASGAALTAGAPARAATLLDQARQGSTDPYLLARAQQLDGHLHVATMRGAVAPSLFLGAARQFLSFDQDMARVVVCDALSAFLNSQYLTQDVTGAEIASVAFTSLRKDAQDSLRDLLLHGIAVLLTSGYPEAVPPLRRSGQMISDGSASVEEILHFHTYGYLAEDLCDEQMFIAWSESLEALARTHGASYSLLVGLIARGTHQIRAGQFSAAEQCFAECLEVIRASGTHGLALYSVMDVELLAWRGDESGARSAAKTLIEIGESIGVARLIFQAHHALAVLELGAGNYSEALTAAQFCLDRQAIGWTTLALPLVVEAGLRSGDRITAERALSELDLRATTTATPWALGLLRRAQALMMADDSAAEELFEASIAHLEQTLIVTDLALAHLSYGEWLRRQRRRVDARVQLRMAYEAFENMGAVGFAERALAELLATGERVSRRSLTTTNDLTPQELKIAQLASGGATNPEIAAHLFLSTSTVDYHLRKVFRKLGITSRRQLGRSLF